MASKPTQTAYAFDVIVPLKTSPDDVMDMTASTVGLEDLYCVQHFGGWNYKVASPECVSIVPLSPRVTQVTVMFLPCCASRETLS